MKIAVLLPGHIRTWDYCKENFINTIYDTNHKIDVFVDTYNEIFRTDYPLHDEDKMNIVKSDEEIFSLFEGINVVDFKIETQLSKDPSAMQMNKILKITKTYEEYEKKYGKYDLVIRSRFDILLDKKINYEKILYRCKDKKIIYNEKIIDKQKNSKIVYIGNGAVHRPENDMFAICDTDTFKIYGKRFLQHSGPHESMIHIANKYNILYSQTIGISIVRLGGPGESVESKTYNKTYKIFK